MNLLLAAVTLLVFYTVKLFYSNLWVPWRTEHHFKRQAIGCPGYCLIFGNSSEIRRATLCGSQVRGKCVRPPWHHGTRGSILWSVVSQYGKTFLYRFSSMLPLVVTKQTWSRRCRWTHAGSMWKFRSTLVALWTRACGTWGLSMGPSQKDYQSGCSSCD